MSLKIYEKLKIEFLIIKPALCELFIFHSLAITVKQMANKAWKKSKHEKKNHTQNIGT